VSELDDLRVSLILVSEHGDARSVTEVLGIQPVHAHSAGEPRTGRLRGSTFKNSVWRLESDLPRSARLDDHIRSILNRVLPKAEEIERLCASKWRLELRCGIFINGTGGGGTIIGADAVSGIARLGAEIGLDIYSDDEAESAGPD
jgi:hypothetical protein